MKLKLAHKLEAILFTFCIVLSLMSIAVFAAEGDTDITEVNINGVSNELWSYKDVSFATVDESSNYTIESQEWHLNETEKITPTSENLKPTVDEEYTFNIKLKAKDGYVFPSKSSEAKTFYGGVFKANGNECENSVIVVSEDNKTLIGLLFIDTRVKGYADIPGGNTEVKTTVRDNYTDCEVTDDINLKKGSDYIIDFTKEDNLSMALRSMADLEKTKYYKFANSDNNSLIETEDASEALIKIVGNKSQNKAIMSLLIDINENTSYTLSFMRTRYTGAKLTYTGTSYDKETGKTIIEEIRDDYYTKYHFNCKLNLIAHSAPTSQPSSSTTSNNYKVIEGENSSWVQNTDGTLTFRTNGDFSKFLGIKVDDSWVDSENYTATSGSTVVTLKNEYLKTLSEDKHKITFVYKNGECSTNFEVKKTSEREICENSDTANTEEKEEQNENLLNPGTGDNNMLLWASLISVSLVGMLEIIIYDRKKILINL